MTMGTIPCALFALWSSTGSFNTVDADDVTVSAKLGLRESDLRD